MKRQDNTQRAVTPPSGELVDSGDIPGGGELHLLRYGDEYSIQFRGDELMGSRDYHSEQALATIACERLGNADGHVLIGGFGMGFTLGAALSAWSPASAFVVVELIPKVLEWAKGPLVDISGKHLRDPRVSIRLADVHDVIAAANEEFDAILLDVDNGPDGFIRPHNDRLYSAWGLRDAYGALRSGGMLAVWSAYSDPNFVAMLETTGFEVDEVRIPAFPGSDDEWHMIWLARKPARGGRSPDAPTRPKAIVVAGESLIG